MQISLYFKAITEPRPHNTLPLLLAYDISLCAYSNDFRARRSLGLPYPSNILSCILYRSKTYASQRPTRDLGVAGWWSMNTLLWQCWTSIYIWHFTADKRNNSWSTLEQIIRMFAWRILSWSIPATFGETGAYLRIRIIIRIERERSRPGWERALGRLIYRRMNGEAAPSGSRLVVITQTSSLWRWLVQGGE